MLGFYSFVSSTSLQRRRKRRRRSRGGVEEEEVNQKSCDRKCKFSIPMEKHTCKFCSRQFSNGRALGGHMRSHVISTTAKSVSPPIPQRFSSYPISSSSSGPVEENEVLGVGVVEEEDITPAIVGGGGGVEVEGCYRLRENPRKSFKFSDPEFSALDYFNLAGANGNANTNTSFSVVVQDRESETESSIPASTSFRRRSKRCRRRQCSSAVLSSPPQIPPEVEPVSSVSDATPDEDVALCLIMLSRDVWSNSKTMDSPKQEEEDEEEEEDNYVMASSSSSEEEGRIRRRVKNISSSTVNGNGGGRSRFQCGTCKKVFRSYQALGGHRASHKRMKDQNGLHRNRSKEEIREVEEDEENDQRIHECPFCFRVFNSGQALGGHKRSHLVAGHSLPLPPLPPKEELADEEVTVDVDVSGSTKIRESLIDLNLPAPMEDGNEEEVEFSAVSNTS